MMGVRWLSDVPISSEGFLSLKCSHTRINVSVFSGVGHSPCLKNTRTHGLGDTWGKGKKRKKI